MPPEDYWPPDLPEPVTYRGPVTAPTEEAPAPEQPVEYSNSAGDFGQPYTGLPVIVEGNQASYNGVPMASEAAAFQARQADAANPQRQAAFQQAEQQRAALQAESPGGNAEPTSIQLRAKMDRNQLSRADQVELTQIQNGIARLNRDAREGRVPLTQAQQLVQALEGRANPLMIRASTARSLERLLQYQLTNEHLRQMSAANVANEQFRSASGLRPILHTEGNRTFLQQSPTHWVETHPERPSQGSDTPRPMTSAQTAGFRRSAERAVAMDPSFIGKPPAQIAAEVERRFQSWTRQPGAENVAPARPIDLPDDTPLSRLPADQREILLQLNHDQAMLAGESSKLSADEKTEAQTDIARARLLFRQFGQASSMPPQERAEFLAISRRLDQLSGRSPNPGRPNGRPSSSAASPATSDSPLQGLGMS